MSWRLIFAILLLTAGASAWGGLRLGDWLIANGPVQVEQAVTPPELSDENLLGSDGKPYVASAPQPLANGRLGVPDMPPPVVWQVEDISLMDMPSKIALATTTISMDQAIAIAAGESQFDDIDDIINLTAGSHTQPIDIPDINTPQSNTTPDSSWQSQFQRELKACENVGFFSRPSCAWAARNKYCEPNNAWGKIDGCPAKN